MNTIRFFLFGFILFSIVIVSFILEHSPSSQVLPSRVVSVDRSFSELLPPHSQVLSASQSTVYYSDTRTPQELLVWYQEKYQHSDILSADEVFPITIKLQSNSNESSIYIIKLDQNDSGSGTKGSIHIQSS